MSRIVHPPTRDRRWASASVNKQVTARVSVSSLRRSLSPPLRRLLTATEAVANERGVMLWAVGGAPRDLAFGQPINDLDLAIGSDPGRFIRALSVRLPGVEVGATSAFGTVGVTLAGSEGPARLDLARLRSEAYERPGALPVVRWTSDIERDLARRDFTVNAIALGLTGEHRNRVVDPFQGLADIVGRRLRVLHARSFEDDATRLWRGARVAAARRIRPDTETAQLIEDGVRWASTVSGDRWMGELDLTARRRHVAGTVRLLDHWGVLRAIHPAWTLDARSARALARHSDPMSAARLAAMLLAPLPASDGVLTRLAASSEVRNAVRGAAHLLAVPASPSTDALAELERIGEDARTAARWLAPERAADWRALERWRRTKTALGAEDVMALGVSAGPALGNVLRELRRARFERTLTSKAAERELVRRAVEHEASR